MQKMLSRLPKVGKLLDSDEWKDIQIRFSREQVKGALETELSLARQLVLSGAERVPGQDELLQRVSARLNRLLRSGPRPVINATGVVIHTNLGRSPLLEEAVIAAAEAAGYCNLELELETGERGSRHSHVEELLCRLTGAGGAMVVNNNAAGVMLALSGLARGQEGIIARGQLVEIGGSFRVPEVMMESGIRLVEVGTTNRVYIEDYRRAIGPETGVILRVHPSNFRVVGFHEEVTLEELVSLGLAAGVPVLDDLGSGTLVDLRPWGIDEPTVQQSVAAGADLVCFSGDKMLGGPQCGIICGSESWISKLKAHPLARALRCDKITLAALAATLGAYMQPEGWQRIPVLAMLVETIEDVAARAKDLSALLQGLPAEIEIESTVSPVGGGALPLHQLKSRVVRILPRDISATALARALRLGETPLVARIHEGAVLLDLRTVADSEVPMAAQALTKALGGGACD